MGILIGHFTDNDDIEEEANKILSKQEYFIDYYDGKPLIQVDSERFYKICAETALLFGETTTKTEGNKTTLIYRNRIID